MTWDTVTDVSRVVGDVQTADNLDDYVIDGLPPLAVAIPADEFELSDIVALADKEGVPVVPWGGGTRTYLGNPLSRAGVVVDLSKLNKLVSHNSADLTASFQAGATLTQISETLAREGQLLAIDPPLPGKATIGGTLATGVSGPLKWQFAHPRDTVIGMKVVQPDGTVTKSGGGVVKNVSGYDMSRLHIGGLGSLGTILEATFKLTPIPMYERTIVSAFDSIEQGLGSSLEIYNSHVMPLAMTLYDAGVARAFDPDATGSSHYLAVRLGGRPRTLDRQVDEVIEITRRAGASPESIEGSSANKIWRSLADFGWDPDSMPILNIRLTVLPSRIGQIADLLRSERTGKAEPAIISQPGFGTVEASWFSDDGEEASVDRLGQIVSRLRRRVAEAGGHLVVQNCPVELKRQIDVWGDERSGIEVMRRLKSQYDPNRIMNPGRYVGGL